jgi:hypothetical protein
MLDTIKMKFFLKMNEIENQRNETMSDVKFQQWMRELNVSQSYEDPTLKLNARDVQSQYSRGYKSLNFKF